MRNTQFFTIPTHPDYEVTQGGKVRRKGTKKYRTWYKASTGYYKVAIMENDKRKLKSVHRLVAITFLPNPDNLSEVNHKDGDKSNNIPENLEWCTHRDNIKHGHKMGLMSTRGETHPRAQLKTKDVIEIKRLIKLGMRGVDIAKKFNVRPQPISDIKRGKNWKHLQEPQNDNA